MKEEGEKGEERSALDPICFYDDANRKKKERATAIANIR